MRITDLDRRRAIKRHPEFEKDYKCYKKLKGDKKELFLSYFWKKWGYSFEVILHADEVAKKRKDSRSVRAVHNLPAVSNITPCRGEKTTPMLKDNKLYLRVDLKGRTKDQLKKDFLRAIEPYRDLLKITKERDRKAGPGKDIWEVYDKYLQANKNKAATTRRWFKNFDKSKDDFDSLVKQITRAVSNAEAIINTITEERGLK